MRRKDDNRYALWKNLRQRCSNPNHPKWPRYGGRGITVHPAWNDFEAFCSDMGPRAAGLSIDRIDNDGNYEPSNCHWATAEEQARNKDKQPNIPERGACINGHDPDEVGVYRFHRRDGRVEIRCVECQRQQNYLARLKNTDKKES